MKTYNEQAKQFLNDTGSKLEITFLYTGKHFHNDEENRDVYQFTLTNKQGTYSAKFGDSMFNTEKRKFANEFRSFGQILANPDVIRARNAGFAVLKGVNKVSPKELKAAKNHKPSEYDILSCLDLLYADSFDEFCDEFGYNELPLSGHDASMKMYLSCKEQDKGLRKLFTSEQLEQLQEIN